MSKYNAFGNSRGNKLWESNRMILPEQRKYLLERELHDEQFQPRPDLDEDKMQEMSQTLGDAMQRGVLVTVWVYHQYGNRNVVMMPQRVNAEGDIVGLDRSGKRVKVPMRDVLDVERE